jgi:hypothetical protein
MVGAKGYMRRFARVVVLALGLIVTAAGVAAAVFVGPGDTVGTGEHRLTTETAVLTAPESALNFMGPTLHASATASEGEIFIGIAHEVDVSGYLDDVEHDQIDRFEVPWSPQLQRSPGEAIAPPALPGGLDWWYDQASGQGRQSVAVELAEEPLELVIMNAEGEAPLEVDVELGLEIENLFLTTLLLVGVGVLLLLIGIFALRRRRPNRIRTPWSEQAETVHS